MRRRLIGFFILGVVLFTPGRWAWEQIQFKANDIRFQRNSKRNRDRAAANVVKDMAAVKDGIRTIQTALERYASDHGHYPPFLIGGDKAGWEEWHRRFDEPNPIHGQPQNAWLHDPLIAGGYLESYPINPFVDNGNAVLQQTGAVPSPAGGYAPGDGDPRFGFEGTKMGNGIEDPRYFLRWNPAAAQEIETSRTLNTSSGGWPDRKGFGVPLIPKFNPDYPYDKHEDFEPGMHYTFGGRRVDTGNVFTHWPGNFFYRAIPSPEDIEQTSTATDIPSAAPKHYILGGFGHYRAEGLDVIRLEATSIHGVPLTYRHPPGWKSAPMQLAYPVNSPLSGGLPEVFGGGDAAHGPWFPYNADPGFPGQLLYGAPDGAPDAVILVLGDGGYEVEWEEPSPGSE